LFIIFHIQPAPFSKRDGVDSCNDETFGSTEQSTQDRAEEERKRRGLCFFPLPLTLALLIVLLGVLIWKKKISTCSII
jgi:hypothetical protein